MSEAIITALIMAAASVLCQVLINKKAKAENTVAEAVRNQKIDDELKTINKKLDIHNGYAEKFGEIAVSIAEIKTEIRGSK